MPEKKFEGPNFEVSLRALDFQVDEMLDQVKGEHLKPSYYSRRYNKKNQFSEEVEWWLLPLITVLCNDEKKGKPFNSLTIELKISLEGEERKVIRSYLVLRSMVIDAVSARAKESNPIKAFSDVVEITVYEILDEAARIMQHITTETNKLWSDLEQDITVNQIQY